MATYGEQLQELVREYRALGTSGRHLRGTSLSGR